jgi:hypothetical protein
MLFNVRMWTGRSTFVFTVLSCCDFGARHVVTKRTNVTEKSSSNQYLDLQSDCPQNQTAVVRPQSFAVTLISEVDQE